MKKERLNESERGCAGVGWGEVGWGGGGLADADRMSPSPHWELSGCRANQGDSLLFGGFPAGAGKESEEWWRLGVRTGGRGSPFVW